MKAGDSPDQISYSTICSKASSYSEDASKDLLILQELRLNTIPETLAKRRKDGHAFLEKTEVINLVDWKLLVL